MEQGEVPPFCSGHRYLLVEHRLARYLEELQVERVTFEPAVLLNPITKEERYTHTRVRVGQFFRAEELRDLSLEGRRLLALNDQYYFVSPELKAELECAPFQYLQFSEGLNGFGGAAT
jgi:hypothetical protein